VRIGGGWRGLDLRTVPIRLVAISEVDYIAGDPHRIDADNDGRANLYGEFQTDFAATPEVLDLQGLAFWKANENDSSITFQAVNPIGVFKAEPTTNLCNRHVRTRRQEATKARRTRALGRAHAVSAVYCRSGRDA